MMDTKTWLWKKKYSEKTIIANGETDLCSFDTTEQVSFDVKELILQESLDLLNDKLASILRECDVKDELVADYAEKAENAMAGKEKAESEVTRLKEELNQSLRERAAENDRTIQLNAALKGSMQQLNSVREEQEKRISDAVITISKEHQESNARLTSLTAENSHLKMALIQKEMLVRELSKCKAQTEAELDVLMVKLDSMEKENVFMRYEFRMLEKEFDVCNEEMNFSRYSLNASNNKNLESSKKMKRIEEECERLRGLLRKRLPGPDSLTNFTREVELQSSNLTQSESRTLEPKKGSTVIRNYVMGSPEIKKMDMLMARLPAVEEENKVLKEILVHKDGDNNYSTLPVCRTSEVDSQVAGHYMFIEHVPDSKAGSEAGKDCRVISSQSSASSSVFEVEQCKLEDSKNKLVHKMLGVSDMSLMDDFVEMEKLATMGDSVQSSSDTCSSPHIGDILNPALTNGSWTDKEVVPVGQIELNGLDISTPFDWIQHVTNIIMNQNKVSGRSLKEAVEDLLISLPEISGIHTWGAPIESERGSSSDEILRDEILLESPRKMKEQSILLRSILRIMEVIRKLDPHYSEENAESLERHEVIHAFKWNMLDISAAINRFLEICDNMLEGKVKIENFTEELASELVSIMNSCVSVKVSSSLKGEAEDENDKKTVIEVQSNELTAVKAELNEALQKLLSLEVELDEKSDCCEELEQKCVQLQLQLESSGNNKSQKDDGELNTKERENSSKEIKESILVVENRLSLLEQIKLEDTTAAAEEEEEEEEEKKSERLAKHGNLAMVAIKKRGGRGSITFLKKLFYKRKKRTTNRNLSFPLIA